MILSIFVRRSVAISAFVAVCLFVGLFLVRNRGLLADQARLAAESGELRRKLDGAVDQNNFRSLQRNEAETLSRSVPSTAETRRRALLAKFDDAHLAPLKREPTPPSPDGSHGNIIFAELLDDPEYFRYAQESQLGRVEVTYGPLLRSVSASIRPRVTQLLADQLFVEYDAEEVAVRSGFDLDRNPNEVRRIVRKALEPVTDELRNLVGDAALAQANIASLLSNGRSRLMPIVQRLSYSAEPLSPEQTHRFMELAVAPSANGRPISMTGLGGTMSQTRSVFSPGQWALLEEYVRETTPTPVP